MSVLPPSSLSRPRPRQGAAATRGLLDWISWVGLALYGVCGLAFWVRSDWRPEWDSAIYLLLGRSLAEGAGYRYLGQPFFLRPPGLPWLLSVFAQEGRYDYELLNRWLLVAAVAALASALLLLRARHSRPVAALVVALVGTSSLFLRQLNWVVADLPFVALLLASFALLERATRAGAGERFWAWSVAGALVLAAAVHLRTVGLLVLPSLLLLGERRGPVAARLRGLLPAVLVLVLTLPWLIHARAEAAAAVAPSEQLLLFTYSSALWHQDPGDPASPLIALDDLLARGIANGGEFARGIAGAFTQSTGTMAQGLVVGLVLFGMTMTWRAGPGLLDGFAATYALLLLAYFTFDLRLLLPLLPSLYLYSLEGARSAWRFAAHALGRRDSGTAALVALAVVLAVANATQSPAALHPEEERLGSATSGQGWEDQRRIALWLAHNTAPGAGILADQAPVLALLSERPVYSYRFRRGAGLLDRLPIDFVVLPPQPQQAILEEVRSRCERLAQLPLSGRGRSATIWRVSR